MNARLIVGILLLVWVAYELFSGSTRSFTRYIERKKEPNAYWAWTSFRLLLAVWSLASGLGYAF